MSTEEILKLNEKVDRVFSQKYLHMPEYVDEHNEYGNSFLDDMDYKREVKKVDHHKPPAPAKRP